LRNIAPSSAIVVFWQDLVFLEAALLADEETKDLAALVTPALDEFPSILQRDLDTRRAVIQAQARAFVADGDIDMALRSLFSAVLGLVQQNRKRQEFTTLFSSSIADVVRHALRKQIEVASSIVDKLSLKLYPDDLRNTHTKLLGGAIKRGKAVLEEMRKAETGRVDGRLDIRTWKDEANAARLNVYGQLLTLAAKNGRGKAWAEGFFPRAASADAADEASDAPEPSPAAAEPAPAAKPA
jgi:hypothetical protein